MGETEYLDYYELDSLLTKEERGLRDRVREFVDEACLPIIAGHFVKGTFPLDLLPPNG
jgi:glutaryl-CoA dehydrogenase